MVRAAIVSALLVAASAACSLFTDFGGIAGADDDAPPNGGDASGNGSDGGSGNDANVAGDGPGADGTQAKDVNAADAGDGALPQGVLSSDDFESTCTTWESYVSTVEHVTDAHGGMGACKICLTMDSAAGGIRRTYPNAPAGTYSVTAYVKNINSTDWRITIDRTLDDAPTAHYGSGVLTGGWQLAQTAVGGSGPLSIALWFGAGFKAGDCAIVDDVTVRVDP